jgi:ATP-dependent helicase/DNAse subunit B
MHLSASKVDCFFGCKRLFFYKYVEKRPEPANKYFIIGNIAHNALEKFHKNNKKLPQDVKRTLKEYFEEAANTYKYKDYLFSGLLKKSDMHGIKDMLKKYAKRVESRGFPNVVSVEKMFRLTINKIPIWGKADRVDRFEDDLYIIDYKTSARPASKVDELTSVQLPIYGLWAKREFKDFRNLYGVYFYLRHSDKTTGIHKHQITDNMINSALEKFNKVNHELNNNCSFDPNYKYKYCGRFCNFWKDCKKDG